MESSVMGARPDLATIVEDHRRRMFAVALTRTGDVDVADDVVQTVLLRVSARRSVADLADPRAYLIRAVVNQCRNVQARSKPSLPLLEGLSADGAETPAGSVANRELGDLLRTAIRGLPEAHRTVVWLVHVEGLTPAEVAGATGTSANTVKSALARGRRTLRERLGPVLRKAGYLEV